MPRIPFSVFAPLLVALTAFATPAGASDIEANRLSEIVKVLASDEFEGRAPGGPGEQKTIDFLSERFAALGLEPGGENGGWTHTVPLVHTQVRPTNLEFAVGSERIPLQQAGDIAVDTSRPLERIGLDRIPVVFVGFHHAEA